MMIRLELYDVLSRAPKMRGNEKNQIRDQIAFNKQIFKKTSVITLVFHYA
jgi:hypothetical protein